MATMLTTTCLFACLTKGMLTHHNRNKISLKHTLCNVVSTMAHGSAKQTRVANSKTSTHT